MMANKLTKEMFQDVIAFFVSEWGAMGPNGTMGFYTRSGEYFQVNYLSEETPYQKVKEYFPALQGCCWNARESQMGIGTSIWIWGIIYACEKSSSDM